MKQLPLDWQTLRRVPGWMTEAEAEALYALGAKAPDPAVEVGCYCGRGAAILALAGRRVWTVDPCVQGWGLPHGGPVDHIAAARDLWTAKRVEKRITLLEGYAEDEAVRAMAPQDIGLLFLDGDHQSPSLRLQLDLWASTIVPGGYLGVHDWGQRGDQQGPWDIAGGVTAWATVGWGPVGRVDSLAWLRRS